jgi:hypothetical protein
MRISKLLLVIAVGLLGSVGSAAAATQLDARDSPEASGPLEQRTKDCRAQNETFEGTVVAMGRTCLRIYQYDTASETDANRDYGVVWLQANVNSSHRWCSQKVISDVDLPSDIQVGEIAPSSLNPSRSRTYRTKLSTDADGNGSEPAQITQDQVIYPDAIRTRVVTDGNIFRLKWTGDEDDKLGFASGAQISWDASDTPGGSSFHLNYSLRKSGC